MSDEVTYEFVKGQGWVPKRKLPDHVKVTINADLIGRYDNIFARIADAAPYGDELDYVLHHGAGGQIYRERRPRRAPRWTFEEFQMRVERLVRPGGDWELRYRLNNGLELRWIVPEAVELPVQRANTVHALRQMYEEAERRGF